mgnify:CR=1 FL=1
MYNDQGSVYSGGGAIAGFGDNSVNYELLVWFDCRRVTYNRLRGQLNFHIWDALKEAGIGMPFPQRDVHLKSIDFADELFNRGGSGGDDGPPPPYEELIRHPKSDQRSSE